MTVNLKKHIWEGWTVEAFIMDLNPIFTLIMTNRSHIKPFTTKEEVKKWTMENQPGYKKHIPEVVEYFWSKIQIEEAW